MKPLCRSHVEWCSAHLLEIQMTFTLDNCSEKKKPFKAVREVTHLKSLKAYKCAAQQFAVCSQSVYN